MTSCRLAALCLTLLLAVAGCSARRLQEGAAANAYAPEAPAQISSSL